MNIKHNYNYFFRSDATKFIGLGLAVVGFAMLWFGWGYIAYILCTVGMPVGIALFFIGTAGRSSEEDIDECIKRGCEGVEVRLEEDKHYAKKLLKNYEPIVAEGYEYEDGLLFKKGKNGTLRSSKYTKAIIYVMSDGLYVSRRTVNLVAEDTQNDVLEIPYTSISSVEIMRERRTLRFGKKSFQTKVTRFIVNYDGGTLSLPMHDDVNSDRLAERISLEVAESKKLES